MSEDRCETCKFYISSIAECHRHAPSVVIECMYEGVDRDHCDCTFSSFRSVWPGVNITNWCGEYEEEKEK